MNQTGVSLINEPLSHYTTWRVGGQAHRLYKPQHLEDVRHCLKNLAPDEPLLWLGLGSNSLIRDNGFKGTVILTQGCLKEMTFTPPNIVRVEAGVSCASMARFCARHDLADAEFWAGIPGTMGGALRMNAGCFNGETWNQVVSVETFTRDGEHHLYTPDKFQINYRQVLGLAPDEGFVAATFAFPKGQKETSLQIIKALLERRAQTQPTNEYNCGSVFRNPPNDYAARLIEQCGLKGKKLGHAMVSPKHANFIINENGQASAKDIESLITLVQQEVYQKTNVKLIREVHIIGEST